MIGRTAQAIYCDDIRTELGGKNSFMGVYETEMVIPAFPITLPKLCAQLKLLLPKGKMPNSIRFMLLSDDSVMAEALLTEEQLHQHPPPQPAAGIPIEDFSIGIVAMFAFAPVTFEKPTTLKVRIYADDEEIKGNSLRVRIATESEASAMGFISPE